MNKQLMMFLIILSTFSFSFSDSNGIWTYAEDIRSGTFGDDEVGSNFTFNDVVYFNQDLVYKSTKIEDLFVNRSGDSMTGALDMNNNNITNVEVIKGNRAELSGVSNIYRVVSDRYFSSGSTAYYLNPAGTSRIDNLQVIGSLEYAGTSIDNVFVNEGQANSIDSSMIQDGAITTNEIDLSSVDSRYVNRGGDTMMGGLDMGDNNIENVNNVRANAFVYTSDRNLKENFKNLSSKDLLNKILKLNSLEYNYLGFEQKEIGLIAQEVQELFPQVVFENTKGDLGVDYVRLVPILINVIQSQQEQIEENSQKIDELKELYAELEEE